MTILGPGGVGKTVLARALADASMARFAGNVTVSELAPVNDPALVSAAVAAALGFKPAPGPVALQVAAHLGDKEHLLILDNCEHQVPAVTALIQEIAKTARRARIVVTSQARIGLMSENIFVLEPLATPSDVTLYQVEQSPAAILFATRAAQSAPGFRITEANAEAVKDICHRLDGIPLALELAAARVGVLGAQGVSTRLDQRLKLLTKGPRGAVPRHATLQAALAWSYDLLTTDEQFVFRCLGVFRGGFTADDVQAVAIDNNLDQWTALDALSTLIDRSLVARKHTVDLSAEPRFTLLETMAEYAVAKLTETGEMDAMLARHAELLRSRLRDAQDAQWTPRGSAKIDRLVLDIANLRAALQWASDQDGDRDMLIALAGMGSMIWTRVGADGEGLSWCETALRTVTGDTQPALEAELLVAFARLSHQTDADREVAALERASALFASQLERKGQYVALGALAKKHVWRRDLEGAERAIEAAQAIFEPAWPSAIQANILQAKTYLHEIRGRPEEGEPFMIELLAIMRALGDPGKIDMAMIDLAENYMVQGKFEEAAALRQAVHDRVGHKTPDTNNLGNLCATYTQMDRLDEALACARESAAGLKRSNKVYQFLEHFGLLCCKRRRLIEGAHLIGLSDAHYRASGFDREMSEARARSQAQALLRAAFDEELLTQLYAEGCQMSVADALDSALSA